MEDQPKTCPFKDERICNENCALFLHPEEINETFGNKLKSIGVLSSGGMCAIKNIALAESRKIFESSGRARH